MGPFYSNENFPLPVVEALRALGHDVQTSVEAGNANQCLEDARVLAFASQNGRVLLTLNRKHFLKLHQQTNGRHAGIVLCTVDRDWQGQAQRIHAEVSRHASMEGMLLRVNRPNPAS